MELWRSQFAWRSSRLAFQLVLMWLLPEKFHACAPAGARRSRRARPAGRRREGARRGHPEYERAPAAPAGCRAVPRLRRSSHPQEVTASRRARGPLARWVPDWSRARSCLECLSQSDQCLTNSRFHCSQWIAGAAGDLGMRQSFKIGELEALALLLGQVGEDGSHLLHHAVALGLVRDVDGRRQHHVVDRVCELAPAQQVDGPVARDHDQPRTQRTASLNKGGGCAPELEENFLHYVLCLTAVMQDPECYRVHSTAVAPEDCFHCAFVPLADPRQECRIF